MKKSTYKILSTLTVEVLNNIATKEIETCNDTTNPMYDLSTKEIIALENDNIYKRDLKNRLLFNGVRIEQNLAKKISDAIKFSIETEFNKEVNETNGS